MQAGPLDPLGASLAVFMSFTLTCFGTIEFGDKLRNIISLIHSWQLHDLVYHHHHHRSLAPTMLRSAK